MANKEKLTAMRTLETKNQIIDNEYIWIDEHEKIVNEKINAITQDFTISRMHMTSQFEKDLLQLKQEYENEIKELASKI